MFEGTQYVKNSVVVAEVMAPDRHAVSLGKKYHNCKIVG